MAPRLTLLPKSAAPTRTARTPGGPSAERREEARPDRDTEAKRELEQMWWWAGI